MASLTQKELLALYGLSSSFDIVGDEQELAMAIAPDVFASLFLAVQMDMPFGDDQILEGIQWEEVSHLLGEGRGLNLEGQRTVALEFIQRAKALVGLAAGMEEAMALTETPEPVAAADRFVPVAVENKVLILGPRALGALKAASYLKPTDAPVLPIVLVVENADQKDKVKAWARDLLLPIEEVVDASLLYGGDAEKALKAVSRYYASERGMSPIVARTLKDLPEIARLLGVPEPEAFARQAEFEALRDLASYNL
ncbi:MAG: hypothetical protein HYZ90_03665 [Candidatus Omnitrophica bacterium]|nr:hypothetical protein [Candidatus Omnitrophota bacterium]